MRLSEETHKEPCFLLVYNPDNTETSESWLEFAAAAAKLSAKHNQIAEALPLGSDARAGLGPEEA